MKKLSTIFLATIAALSFSSCQKEVLPEEPGGKMVTVNFDVHMADETRVAAQEGSDVVSYKWTNEDKTNFKLVQVIAGSDGKESYKAISNPVLTFSNNNRTLTVKATVPVPSTLRAFVAGKWTNSQNPRTLETQSPATGNFDPNAIVLVSEDEEVQDTGEDQMEMNGTLIFNRPVTVNKMTLKGLTSGEKVTKVVLSSDKYLTGYYSPSSASMTGDGKTITMNYNATVGQSGEFPVYFVAVPGTGHTLTVDVETSNGSYSKTFGAGGINFAKGKFGKFSVALPSGQDDDKVVLFSEGFGNNSGSAREWKDDYKEQGGIPAVYSNAAYTVSNAKQSKNTMGSTKSALVGTNGQNAYFEVGPLNLSGCSDLSLDYKWNAGSIKGTYSTTISYKTSKNGTYKTVSHSAKGATTYVGVAVDLPEEACVGTLYLKIGFYTSNAQSYIDEVHLTGVASDNPGGGSGEELNAVVVTGSATGITSNGATLNATYTDVPTSNLPQNVVFKYGTSSSNLNKTIGASEVVNSSSGSFTATFNATLSSNTTYWYQASMDVWDAANSKYVTITGEVKSFTTAPTGETGGKRNYYELPAINAVKSGEYLVSATNSNIYYAYHMCNGGETYAFNGQQVKARNYTVCFSGTDHVAYWVAAPRHTMYNGSYRTDDYGPDKSIPTSVQYLKDEIGSDCNRGHILGSAERGHSKETNRQVFYFSNIAPQLSSGFNTGGGGWNKLEDWVDSKVCSDTLYQVVGCYFKDFTDGYGYSVQAKKISYGGRDDVSFPTMFYYVLIRTKSGKSGKALKDCSADELMCAAFVRSHTNSLKGQAVTRSEMMTVSALEKITGFRYFVNVPNAPKDVANASDWGL